MKALLLAAGLGTRLSPITDSIPKSLVKVNETPIIINQINSLIKNNIKNIIIVSGYKSQILQAEIEDKYPFVQFINNKDFNTTNNMYSAYLSKNFLYEQPFIMMNSDVFFDETVISSLLSDTNDNCIVVDKGAYNDESMKISVTVDGKINKISKDVNSNASYGCSIDVYKFSSIASKAFFDKCTEYIKSKELNMWSEVAINDILSYTDFFPSNINGKWLEIDNFDDLKMANKIFSRVS